MTSLSDLFLLEKMKAQTEKYSPDLVVMTGDMIDDGNDGKFNKVYVLRTVAEAFEEMEQYWAYVPGNNDGVNYGTSEDVVAYLSQYDSFFECLFSGFKSLRARSHRFLTQISLIFSTADVSFTLKPSKNRHRMTEAYF
jgi:hypothetical protein